MAAWARLANPRTNDMRRRARRKCPLSPAFGGAGFSWRRVSVIPPYTTERLIVASAS
jgi:hypothetical protein